MAAGIRLDMGGPAKGSERQLGTGVCGGCPGYVGAREATELLGTGKARRNWDYEGGSWQGDVSGCTGPGVGTLACVGRTQGHKGRGQYSASKSAGLLLGSAFSVGTK